MKFTTQSAGRVAIAAVLLCGLTACAAGSAESHHAVESGLLYQVILGFWHGLIAPITLIVEIIRKLAPGSIPLPWRLYELKNTSVAYDVGFYLGLAGGPITIWHRTYYRRPVRV